MPDHKQTAPKDYKCTADDAFKVASCVLEIAKCQSQNELDRVGRRIAISTFSENDLAILRFLWSEQVKSFDKQQFHGIIDATSNP